MTTETEIAILPGTVWWEDCKQGERSKLLIIGNGDEQHLSYADGQCDWNHSPINKAGNERCVHGAHYLSPKYPGQVLCGIHFNHETNRHHKPL